MVYLGAHYGEVQGLMGYLKGQVWSGLKPSNDLRTDFRISLFFSTGSEAGS